MKKTAVQEIMEIAEKQGYTEQDLCLEAQCVADYGECLHIPLMGYSAEAISEAAQVLNM